VAVRYPSRRIAVNVLCCSWSDPRAMACLSRRPQDHAATPQAAGITVPETG